MKLKSFVTVAAVLLFAGCNVGGEDLGDEEEDEYVDPGMQPGDSKMDGNSSVESVVSGTCSTTPVRGLSIQIAEEVRCLAPGLLVPFQETSNIRFASSAVLPYLEVETRAAFLEAAPSLGTVTVNSGLRSLAQQYLLYRWRQARRCGIRAAATPGRSNHETGRALDIANYSSARRTLINEGFTTLRNDPVHFDHLPSPDLRDLGVEAFQRLWNRNHPDDTISEDGVYGSETAKRLARSPSGGFRMGAICSVDV